MRGSAVLSLSQASVNDGQMMCSMGRLERGEIIYLHIFIAGTGGEVISL